MSRADKLHVNDIGRIIEVAIIDRADASEIDLAGTDTVTLKFVKPNGTIVTKTAAIVDGKAQYETAASFLDAAGIWKVQPYVQELDGDTWHGDIVEFSVSTNVN